MATIKEILIGDTTTLTLKNGTVLHLRASDGAILHGATAIPNSNGSKAMGVNVVPDNVVWGQDRDSGTWYTCTNLTTGNFLPASPQPTISTGGTFNAILSSKDGATLALADGKTVSINNAYGATGGDILINGAPVPGGDHSWAVAVVNGVVYGQDGSSGSGGQWYSDTGETSGNWQAVGAPAGLVYFGGGGGGGQSGPPLNVTQAQVDAIMAAITATQVQEVPNGECNFCPSVHTDCWPRNGLPGDVIICDAPFVQASGIRGSLTDSDGNVWSLLANNFCDPQPGDWWWGGVALNGSQWLGVCGYACALRLLPNGEVIVQEAKGSGWWSLTRSARTYNGVGNAIDCSSNVQFPPAGPNNY